MDVLLAALVFLTQDPADQLRRQELALRLEDLASSGRLEALAKAVLRELRGRKVEGTPFDLCWKQVGVRRWDGKLEEFIAAWDKAAGVEAPAPAQALFRARLESLVSKPKPYREKLEEAGKKFPGEPWILWYLALARAEAADHAGTAVALEEMARKSQTMGDPEEFHRLLAVAYAETDRKSAAVEHLRAMRADPSDFPDLAALALKWKLPDEAARLYRMASDEMPERIALKIGLIRALALAGDESAATAERRKVFIHDGAVLSDRVDGYFTLLPAEGRAEEIVRTLGDLLSTQSDPLLNYRIFDALVIRVPIEERTKVAALWEKDAADARAWRLLAHFRRAWGHKPEFMIEALEKGEKAFPNDAVLVKEKIEPYKRLNKFLELSAAYARLVELDPDGKKSGPRPLAAVQDAIRGLVEAKDLGAALRLGVMALSEPALDDAARSATRTAMKPACETPAAQFWEEVRKLKLPAPTAAAQATMEGWVKKLGDDEFSVRAEASRELQKFGLPAIPVLLKHIDDEDAEVRSKARELIRAILSE